MDDTFCSSCPGCRHASVHAITPGTYSIDHNMSWATYFRCCHCGQTWFVCNYVGCTIPSYKNYYVTRQQLKRHARHWHARGNTTGTSSNMLRNVNEASVGDRDEVIEYDIPVDQQDVDDPIEPSDHSLFCFSNKGTAQHYWHGYTGHQLLSATVFVSGTGQLMYGFFHPAPIPRHSTLPPYRLDASHYWTDTPHRAF